jgi:hypothetical protein
MGKGTFNLCGEGGVIMLIILAGICLFCIIFNALTICNLINRDKKRIADLQEINIMLERLQINMERDLKKWEEIHQIAKGGK